MRRLLRVLALGASLLFPLRAECALITGQVGFGGAVVPATNLATTDTLSFLPSVFVVQASGDLAVLPIGSPVAWNGFTFQPFAPVSPLWSAGPFAFDLAQVSIVARGPDALALVGQGTLTGAGFSPTAYDWSLSADRTPSGTFVSFSADNSPTVVPEPATLFLVGTGLLLIARRLR